MAKYSKAVAWHISRHRMTGDPEALVQLHMFANMLPVDILKFNIGERVYCLDPVDETLRGVAGVVNGILVVNREVIYYVLFSENQSELAAHSDVSLKRCVRSTKRRQHQKADAIEMVMRMIDITSEPAERKESEPDISDYQCSLGFHDVVKDQRVEHTEATSRANEAAGPKVTTDVLDVDLKYLLYTPSQQELAQRAKNAVATMQPQSIGLDPEVHELLYDVETKKPERWE